MQIILQDTGKKFNKEWVFRKLNYTFSSGNSYVILGNNGSGKSTLLQVLGGSMLPTEGKVDYKLNEQVILNDLIYKQVALATPYLELFEEHTLIEAIDFHFKFKKIADGIQKSELPQLSLFISKDQNKQIKNFSSGMKQRLRLALAIFSDVPLLLLDEPSSNLDKSGIDWYRSMISNHTKNKLVVVCSNRQEHEYDFCKQQIIVEDYK